MGNWKFNMVLLSTLAALVIIVHSAEEEYENYRRGLRPRPMDTGTRRFEQPWRTLEVEPVMQDSTSRIDMDDNSSEEPPRRRRPGRKRKRRPLPDSAEELDPGSTERFSEDLVRPHFVDFSNERQTSEMPKRRRKKIERRLKWADSLEEDRPLRRRGQRRKRPSEDKWPELSEFSEYRPNEASRNDDEASTDQVMTMNEDRHGDNFGSTPHFTHKQSEDVIESREEVLELDDNTQSKINDKGADLVPTKEDKSFSEFSREMEAADAAELKSKHKKQNLNEYNNLMEPPDALKEMDKSKVTGSIDPLTLKDILKKSNGTSLSEILQQHNLSLTDLLRGKELALSILKSKNSAQSATKQSKETVNKPILVYSEENESSEEKLLQHSETKYVTEPETDTTDYLTTTLNPQTDEDITTVEEIVSTTTEKLKVEPTKRPNISRFPTTNRRKQRIRPVINNNYKSQLNRDMLALSARKYVYNNRRRNTTKTQAWKDIIPLVKKNVTTENKSEPSKVESTTLGVITDETTTYEDNTYTTLTSVDDNNVLNNTTTEASENFSQNETQISKTDVHQTPVIEVDTSRLVQSTTQMNTVGLRRQAFNNILKKKRRKQKLATTEPPQEQDDFMKNLFGMPNLVSSSEFIARTQVPKTSLDDVTVEDFITTDIPIEIESKPRKNRYSTRSPTTYRQTFIPSSTEESAKIEIEEILNDTRANARLSKILKERNMTLSELVEHRERGSSHLHLADIFHNSSKEPSSPEPFLSKSAIEPISKETYPLRALLDANIHDTTAKATTIDSTHDDFINIPMKMDFGKNVNENAENMGIMSLFNNITRSDSLADASTVMKDSEGTPYSATVIVVNASDIHKEIDTVREGRVMHTENQDDIVGWNEIFALMRRNYENQTKESTYIDGLIPAETIRKPASEEAMDVDGLIVLEDLERLSDFNSKVASKEQIDARSNEILEAPIESKSVTKSVTLATASIVGLALVLFLLSFIGYRWWQQRSTADNSFPDERIPTPVFENRKGHKNNSSNRSISPMLSSNIYTLSTLDSQHGKESPDYMWDSLRKPFQ